jgi:hypothetical protein
MFTFKKLAMLIQASTGLQCHKMGPCGAANTDRLLIVLTIEAVGTSETSVNIYQKPRRYIRENRKSSKSSPSEPKMSRSLSFFGSLLLPEERLDHVNLWPWTLQSWISLSWQTDKQLGCAKLRAICVRNLKTDQTETAQNLLMATTREAPQRKLQRLVLLIHTTVVRKLRLFIAYFKKMKVGYNFWTITITRTITITLITFEPLGRISWNLIRR